MKNRNVLIVEDMPDWREQLASTLKRDGYRVTTVASYGEARGELKRNQFQIVVVDLRLSPSDANNFDGMTLLKDLSESKIPAIVVTGYGTAEFARKAFDEYAVVDFLEKKNLDLKKLRFIVKESIEKTEKKENELEELRAKFLRGETIKLTETK